MKMPTGLPVGIFLPFARLSPFRSVKACEQREAVTCHHCALVARIDQIIPAGWLAARSKEGVNGGVKGGGRKTFFLPPLIVSQFQGT